MKCVECGHEQAVGMFCGLCGGKLESEEGGKTVEDTVQADAEGQADTYAEVGSAESVQTDGGQAAADETAYVQQEETQAAYSEQASTHEQSVQQPVGGQAGAGQSSESLDRVVETSKEFGTFFQQFMKTPSQALQVGSQQFLHAIINLVILAVVFSATIYRVTKVEISSIVFEHGSFAFQAFTTIAVSMITVIAIMFALNKLFGDESISFKKVVSIYGVFMVPAVIVGLVSLVFAIIKNTDYAGHFLAILFLLVILFIPLYMAGYFVINFKKNIDPLYAFLLYTVASIVALALVHGIILDSVTGDFVQYMYGLLTSFIYFLVG